MTSESKDDRSSTPNLDTPDVAVTSADVSVNGSDSEAVKKFETGHVRTSSTVKKPVSFKPVSVNKTFLAAKGASAAGSGKLVDKGSAGSPSSTPVSSAPLGAKPRLVAKSSSGMTTPRLTAMGVNKNGAAPDANAVWNKNRRRYLGFTAKWIF
jgi:hypothetical protein